MAVPQLGLGELMTLEQLVRAWKVKRSASVQRSALDLPPLKLGKVLKPLSVEDDLLEEMLDDSRD